MHSLKETKVPRSEIYYGPMKSGKSRYLVKKAEELYAQNIAFLAFKPVLDTRDGSYIRSRHQSCRDIQALAISQAQEILKTVQQVSEQPEKFVQQQPAAQPDCLAIQAVLAHQAPLQACLIDEIFLLDSSLPDVIKSLLKTGISVYMSGLDRDFRGEYFPLKEVKNKSVSMKDIIDQCDRSLPLKARCEICDQPAALTQRLINGLPAPYNSPTVLIGDEEYQPRCLEHHQIEGKPELTTAS